MAEETIYANTTLVLEEDRYGDEGPNSDGELYAFKQFSIPQIISAATINSVTFRLRTRADITDGDLLDIGIYGDLVDAWNVSSTTATMLALLFNDTLHTGETTPTPETEYTFNALGDGTKGFLKATSDAGGLAFDFTTRLEWENPTLGPVTPDHTRVGLSLGYEFDGPEVNYYDDMEIDAYKPALIINYDASAAGVLMPAKNILLGGGDGF